MGVKTLSGAWGPVVAEDEKLPATVFVPIHKDDKPDECSASVRGYERVETPERLAEVRAQQIAMAQQRQAAPAARA